MARPNFMLIVRDNEQAVAGALSQGDFVKAFLLTHTLIEALLRVFLRVPDQEVPFSRLIEDYAKYLGDIKYPHDTFVDELTQLNRRRNRIVHQLWIKGYTHTNREAEPAAKMAVRVYGLFIEWLQTFDPEIAQVGFDHHHE